MKYSNPKLDKIMRKHEFFLIFKDFIESGNFKEHISEDPTMRMHPEKYTKAALDLLITYKE